MTVLVRTSRGIGTCFAIKEINEKAGLDTVELRINLTSHIDDAEKALDAAGNGVRTQALLVDIDNGATPELLSALLSCIESKTMCGRSIEAMAGVVVVMPESEFDPAKFHPLISRSINVQMKDGQKGCQIALESAMAMDMDIALDGKLATIPMAKVEENDLLGLPRVKEESNDPSLG